MNLSEHSTGRPYARLASNAFAVICALCARF